MWIRVGNVDICKTRTQLFFIICCRKNITSGGETAWHGRIAGKEWATGMEISKAGNVALANSVFGKIEFGRRSGQMKL